MKQIYMEQTLMAMAQKSEENPTAHKQHLDIINSKDATLKVTESGIRYVLIESKSEENGKESN
jgi:hypothetical protein